MAKSARMFLFTVVVATSYRHYRHGSITLASKFLGNARITISTLFHNVAMTTVCMPPWTNIVQLRTIPGTLFGTAGSKTGGGGVVTRNEEAYHLYLNARVVGTLWIREH